MIRILILLATIVLVSGCFSDPHEYCVNRGHLEMLIIQQTRLLSEIADLELQLRDQSPRDTSYTTTKHLHLSPYECSHGFEVYSLTTARGETD